MDNTPILNGAPAFIILGFTVALAAYLRQVSLSAQDLIEKIKSNIVSSFPYDAGNIVQEHTREKLKLLENTRDNLSKVTRPLFILMLVIAIRIILFAIAKMKPFDSANYLALLH
jgi:NADH:ubiquinone oxidoreductase subunit 3 (subunit A)